MRVVRVRVRISPLLRAGLNDYNTTVRMGGSPKTRIGAAAMTVTGDTRQEGAAVDISPVVPSRQEVVWVSNVC